MKPIISSKYTFPINVLMMLFAYHGVVSRWNDRSGMPFWLSLAAFVVFLGFMLASFYQLQRRTQS